MDLGKLRKMSEHRVCGVCGMEFWEIPAARGNSAVPVLEQFSDHQATHNPSPAQWVEAHRRIVAGRESAKAS